MIAFDHLVVGAPTLDEGASWLEARLCIPMSAGGKHETMGTHNALVGLGPGAYLEVMAIDPQAPAPGRARWFDLDEPRSGNVAR